MVHSQEAVDYGHQDGRCMDPEVDRVLEARYEEPRCCSMCDAPGHGFPGGGPCPLEDRGWAEGPGHAWEM